MADELTEQISTQGLEEGGIGTPLRHVKGTLDDYEAVTKEREWGQSVSVVLSLSNIQVIKSTEPYDPPIALLPIPYNKKKRSLWGIFSFSLHKVMGAEADIKDIKGKTIELEYTEGHMLWNKELGQETPRGAWELISVGEGVASVVSAAATTTVGPMEEALAILDGKNLQQFNQEALKRPSLRGDSTIMKSIMDQNFAAKAVEAGLVTVDADGVHHAVPAEGVNPSP